VLATLDPLSAMAATEDASLTGLLAALDADGPLGDLLDGLGQPGRQRWRSYAVTGADPQACRPASRQFANRSRQAQDGLVNVTCPECGHDFAIGGADFPADAQ
jgi:hypothetical protein